MNAAAASRLRGQAELVANALAERVPSIEAICLFGSVARGDVNDWSDIDLMVVGSDDRVTRRDLMEALPPQLREPSLSLLYYGADDFDRLRQRSLFVEHFRQEGIVLLDKTGRLTAALARASEGTPSIDEELQSELTQLEPYEHLERFGDNLLFCLSHLYAIGKSIAILQLAKEGVFEFNRELAFQKLRTIAPDKADDLDTIARLRPFYELVTRRKPDRLPFSYRGSGREAEAAVRAIKALAADRDSS